MKPEYLYKFVALSDDPSGHSDEDEKRFHSLSNDEIWFSVPGKMNDPYEFRGIKVNYSRLQEKGVSKAEIADLQKMFREDYVLSSFTTKVEDNFPMWDRYANHHHGFCIRYRVVNDKHIAKTIYAKKLPDLTDAVLKVFYTIQSLKDMPSDSVMGPVYRDLLDMFMRTLVQNYTVKHESWSYEDEYRAVIERDDKGNMFGQNVPVRDVGLCTNAIYAGYQCGYYDRIKAIASGLGVPCYQCKLNDRKFMTFSE